MAESKGKTPQRTTLRMGTGQGNTPVEGTQVDDLPDELATVLRQTDPRATVRTEAVREHDPRVTVRTEVVREKFLAPNDPRLPTKIIPKVAAATAAMAATTVEPQRTNVWVATHERPQSPDQRLIMLRDPDSHRAAAFRVLRHRLSAAGDPRVIVVSSAENGDGKTTLAVNLAMALGECNRARVLLIEANLRRPALAKLFGFQPPICFSDQLATHRERPLDQWSIVEVYSPALHVLAVDPAKAGRPLLDVPALVVAMEALRRSGYDYIVVDTPSILGSADVNLVEEHGDGLLMAIRAGKTRARVVRSALDQLATARLLGFALLDE